MTYLRPFLRLVAAGTLYNLEDFSFSMSLIGGSPLTAPPTVPPAISNAFKTFWATSNLISSSAKLTTIKLNLIGVDGKYVNSNTVRYDLIPPLAGGGSQNPPAQVSYVVSLQTAAARGRAHAGRFYLPLPAQAPDSSGALNLPSTQMYQTATDALLTAIQGAMPDWELGIVSDVGTGAERPVLNARYGKVLDTIRSRREKIPEAYVVGAPLPLT